MNRTFFTAVAAVILSSAASFAAESGNTSPQKTGKDFYRSRPSGGFLMPQPVIVPQTEYTPVIAPRLEEAGQQNNSFSRNRRVPAPPTVPDRTEPPVFASDIVLPGETVILPHNNVAGVIISDRRIDELAAERGIDEKALQHPLSGIDLPKKPDNSKSDIVKSGESMWTFADTAKNDTTPAAVLPVPLVKTTPSTITVPAGIVEQKQQLDDFNSRLAKIQLEKKNLTAVLSLVEKIKSPEFKVKTLVDLAEYVSRDSNYKKEADTLYELAVAGIDALSTGKPVVVKLPEKSVPAKELKREVTLIDTPLEKPEIKQPANKPVSPNNSLLLIEEPEKSLPKPEEKPLEKSADVKPAEVETKPLEIKPEVKPEGKKKLTLIDETEEPLPTLAPKPAETKPIEEPKSAETKSAETKSDSKKKLTLIDETEEPLPGITPKPAETKPAEVKKTEIIPVEELKPAESKQSATAPDAPVRKPMPKRKIVVTD